MQMKFGTKMVIAVSTVLLLYTIVVLIFSWFGKVVPDSLTMALFAAGIGEYSVLGLIKTSDNKYGNVVYEPVEEEMVIHGFSNDAGHTG
jgi:hypothetical protein